MTLDPDCDRVAPPTERPGYRGGFPDLTPSPVIVRTAKHDRQLTDDGSCEDDQQPGGVCPICEEQRRDVLSLFVHPPLVCEEWVQAEQAESENYYEQRRAEALSLAPSDDGYAQRLLSMPLRELRQSGLEIAAIALSDLLLMERDGDVAWVTSRWLAEQPRQGTVPPAVKLVEPDVAAGLAAKLRPLAEELERGIPKARWRFDGLLAGKVYLGGYIGTGKTPTTLRLIRALLAGEDFLGFRNCGIPEDYRVVYLTQEGEGTFLNAVYEAGLAEPALAARISVGYLHNFAMDEWPATIEALAGTLTPEAGLVVVDTQIDWSRTSDENDAAAMSEALRPLNVAIQKRGLDAIIVGHSLKGLDDISDTDAGIQHIRGSGAVVANADVVYVLKKAKPRQDGNVRCLKRVRSRYATTDAPERTYTVIEDGEMRSVNLIEQSTRGLTSDEQRVLTALHEQNGSVLHRDLGRLLHMRSDEVDAAVGTLEREGRVRLYGSGERGDPKGIQLAE